MIDPIKWKTMWFTARSRNRNNQWRWSVIWVSNRDVVKKPHTTMNVLNFMGNCFFFLRINISYFLKWFPNLNFFHGTIHGLKKKASLGVHSPCQRQSFVFHICHHLKRIWNILAEPLALQYWLHFDAHVVYLKAFRIVTR